MSDLKQDRIIKAKEIAEILGVHHFTVLKWLREGKLSGFKIANSWFMTESTLKKVIGNKE